MNRIKKALSIAGIGFITVIATIVSCIGYVCGYLSGMFTNAAMAGSAAWDKDITSANDAMQALITRMERKEEAKQAAKDSYDL